MSFRSAGDIPALFCVCAGGGDIFDYRDLALALQEDQPVYVFGVPPLRGGEVFPTVQRLAAIYVDKVRQLQPQGPYRLCGHSFGGIVVYEMAVLLCNSGAEVDLVALIDTLHPAFKRNLSFPQRFHFVLGYLVDRLTRYARNLRIGKLGDIRHEATIFVSHKCKRAMWKLVRSVCGALSRPVPAAIQSTELILVSAWHRYEPSSFTGRLVLLNAADRPPEYRLDRTLGWGRSTSGRVEVHDVPGDHYSIMHPPNVETLVSHMNRYLSRT